MVDKKGNAFRKKNCRTKPRSHNVIKNVTRDAAPVRTTVNDRLHERPSARPTPSNSGSFLESEVLTRPPPTVSNSAHLSVEPCSVDETGKVLSGGAMVANGHTTAPFLRGVDLSHINLGVSSVTTTLTKGKRIHSQPPRGGIRGWVDLSTRLNNSATVIPVDTPFTMPTISSVPQAVPDPQQLLKQTIPVETPALQSSSGGASLKSDLGIQHGCGIPPHEGAGSREAGALPYTKNDKIDKRHSCTDEMSVAGAVDVAAPTSSKGPVMHTDCVPQCPPPLVAEITEVSGPPRLLQPMPGTESYGRDLKDGDAILGKAAPPSLPPAAIVPIPATALPDNAQPTSITGSTGTFVPRNPPCVTSGFVASTTPGQTPFLHRPRSDSMSFTPEVGSSLSSLVEREVLAYLMLSLTGLHRRRNQLRRLVEYLTKAIRHAGQAQQRSYGAIRYYIFGSVNMRTVLPEGDNDVTIEVEGLLPPDAVTIDFVGSLSTGGRASNDAISPQRGAARQTAVGSTASLSVSADCVGSGIPLPPITTDSSSGNREGTLHLSTTASGKPILAPPAALGISSGDLLSRMREYLQNRSPIYVDTLVMAEVRVLKLLMEGSSYDVTIGQFGGVNCVRFLHEMDAVIGGQHLLKRTLLLLKSWCCYEAHVLGGQAGYIGSYAATVMLISLINTVEFFEDLTEDPQSSAPVHAAVRSEANAAQSDEKESNTSDAAGRWGGEETVAATSAVPDRVTPLILFARFLKFFYYFDYDHYCVTAFGPLRLTGITSTPYDLSQLEVDSAHKTPHPNRANVNTHFLGLTPEGEAAIGHLIRRRRQPLLTVSGVKHLLDEMNTSRALERMRWYEERQSARTKSHPNSVGAGASGESSSEIHRPVQLNRRGNVEEDVHLICPSCTTALFPVRPMNVLDPLRWSSNMVRGVCRNHLQRIRRAFQEGLRLLQASSDKLSCPKTELPFFNGGSDKAEVTATCVPPRPASSNGGSSFSSGGTSSFGVHQSQLPQSPMKQGGTSGYVPNTTAAPSASQVDLPLPGYPSPFSRLTYREVEVLQVLFGNTISAIQRNSTLNCPWGQEEGPPRGIALPQCPTCRHPSVLCTPDIHQMCEPACVSVEDEPPGQHVGGPLGDALVPPPSPPAASLLPPSQPQPQRFTPAVNGVGHPALGRHGKPQPAGPPWRPAMGWDGPPSSKQGVPGNPAVS
ncbi:unnamed protein product [Phytomonas sp. EM1]|nr:unnamed protein product [Phytomonas sp. EM1]|eukprot:CCW64922.1 unnamed protein product [Phytomonas sp. isolate EM1]